MAGRMINFTLNGEPVSAEIANHHTILEVIRNEFALYGARETCGQGLCGCCTVIVNGAAVSGCLYLAAFADGAEVTTIESLDANGTLDPVQEAFIEQGAFQCGFCTPGFILMTKQLLDRHPDPDDDTIKHWLSGNLCRCAAYPEIIAAVKSAATERQVARSQRPDTPHTVMAGHSRSKNSVASLAYVPAIPLTQAPRVFVGMPGTSPGMTAGFNPAARSHACRLAPGCTDPTHRH